MVDPIWESYVMGFSMGYLQEIKMLRSIMSFLNMVACARIICVDGVLLTLNIYRVGLVPVLAMYPHDIFVVKYCVAVVNGCEDTVFTLWKQAACLVAVCRDCPQVCTML
jgi:hypothetical protein